MPASSLSCFHCVEKSSLVISLNVCFSQMKEHRASWKRSLTLYDSCKICLKRLKKVNCMLFLGHLDDMHGVGLLWKGPYLPGIWEIWTGKYIGITEWSLTKPNLPFDKQYIRKLVFYTCLSHFMSRRFQTKYTWETPDDAL